jgi:phage gp29-like protein
MPDYYSVLDHLGRPIEKPSLLQALARANVMGVRQAVSSGASRGLTPQRLASILREAEDGDPERYMQLAEEMEEKDLHYLSVLGTRKRQVSQLDITVEAASEDDPNDQANADLISELNDSGVIDQALFDMLDAVGKGFSVCEIMWDVSGTRWMPKTLEWVDPRFVDWDRETRRVPLLIGNAGERTPLAPGKFLFLQLKAKSGIPIRGGLARAAAWVWMYKNFTVKDWVQFLEVYGQPLRIGKYPQGASDDDINALLRALASIGADFAGVFPQAMQIEFPKTDMAANAGPLFGGAADYWDKQMSKAVLGQTGTTDGTPGQLGSGQDHTEVRKDVEKADAKALMTCLNRQLVRLVVDLNRGPQLKYPWLYIGRPESKDAKLMADVAQMLVPMGAEIEASQITSAAGFTEPAKGAKLLTPPQQAMTLPFGLPQSGGAPPGTLAARQGFALLAALTGAKEDEIERAARENAAQYMVLQPALDQIMAVLAHAKDGEDALARLAALAPELDMSGLAERIARLDLQALAGAITGDRLR